MSFSEVLFASSCIVSLCALSFYTEAFCHLSFYRTSWRPAEPFKAESDWFRLDHVSLMKGWKISGWVASQLFILLDGHFHSIIINKRSESLRWLTFDQDRGEVHKQGWGNSPQAESVILIRKISGFLNNLSFK